MVLFDEIRNDLPIKKSFETNPPQGIGYEMLFGSGLLEKEEEILHEVGEQIDQFEKEIRQLLSELED